MALAPGSRLGRYVIVRQLGAGAMGEVYLAEDPHIDRRVAIKTVRLDVQEQLSETTRTMLALRFEREAKVAGRLVHPHVVTLFDAGDVDGLFFLAFEYIDGPDLAARSRQQPPLTLRDILRIGREAAAALDAAHRVGIIHRDIKPSNLLLTNDGLLKIADFGIATLVGQGTHLTQTGSLIGTPQYLSPEQVKSELALDGRSDLFSLGVVLYELLSGRRPFEGGSMAALLYAVVSGEPRPLDELRPDLPPRLVAAVTRLLAKEPGDRFPTAAAFGDELAAIERELVDTPSAPAAMAPDQAPTVVMGGPSMLPTAAGTTSPEIVPPTFHQPPASAMTSNVPPTTQLDRPVGKSSRQFVVGGVILAGVVIGALASLQWSRGTTKVPAASPPPVEAPIKPRSEETITVTTAMETAAASTKDDAATSDADVYQPVGGAVTFRVSPADAAAGAVVKIDGLVRGLASGSMMTMRAGQHVIEVSAEGYETARLPVDSRSDAPSPTELDITLHPK